MTIFKPLKITLNHIKPHYMSESEVSGSDIYLRQRVVFEQGRKYMVCAKSGHGKSSLLNFIYGSSDNFDGEIAFSFDGDAPETAMGTTVSPATVNPSVLRNSLLSYMFQDLCLFPELTAYENVALKNDLTHHKSADELTAMLDVLLPAEKHNQPVGTLSLGQRQRVAAVRALCQPFRFLLLDEPFSHLDNESAAKVASLVKGEVERQGAGLIVTALDPIDLFDFDESLNL